MSGFSHQYGPYALIAGASEGIGAAFARQIAARGVNLVLVARNQGKLDELAATIRSDVGVEVRTAAIDLTDPDVGQQVASATAGCEVGLLVFNAGARGHYGNLVDDPLEVTLRQIRLNCVASATLCHDMGSAMAARGRGGIILVGSLAALAGAAGIAVYAAGKAFDATLAESLWQELRPKGVHVLALLAGATRTPAMERIGLNLDSPEFPAMDPEDVAREGLEHLDDGPSWVAGESNRMSAETMRSLPRRDAVELMSAGSALMFGVEP
jgi:short-subunit dehydrogenase